MTKNSVALNQYDTVPKQKISTQILWIQVVKGIHCLLVHFAKGCFDFFPENVVLMHVNVPWGILIEKFSILICEP